jgi:hypothetical protein
MVMEAMSSGNKHQPSRPSQLTSHRLPEEAEVDEDPT